jgi:hypothetical protein
MNSHVIASCRIVELVWTKHVQLLDHRGRFTIGIRIVILGRQHCHFTRRVNQRMPLFADTRSQHGALHETLECRDVQVDKFVTAIKLREAKKL